MAGRHYSAASAAAKSRRYTICLISLSVIFLYLIHYVFTTSSSTSSFTLHTITTPAAPNSNADYSFVSSLEKFLINHISKIHPRSTDDTVRGDADERDLNRLDYLIFGEEEKRLYGGNNPFNTPLRVYVYDMPSKFTSDLLWLFHDTYKETNNLTSNGSPVHRLSEHGALKWVTEQPAWKRSEGRDHILPVHHPWSFKTVRKFMKKAIWLLPDMDSTGNWYKPGQVYLEKDLILPYVPNVNLCDA